MSLKVEHIAKYHKDWIRIAVHCGADSVLADDIVQEFYLKLLEIQSKEGNLERISYKNDINRVYAFSMINNFVISYFRKQRNVRFIPAMHQKATEDTLDEQAYETLMVKIEAIIEAQHWYDKELFKLYIYSGKSMRQLAAETRINLHNINNTIQKVKNLIRDECNVSFDLLFPEQRTK